MEEKLLSVEDYAQKIENELREIADFKTEENSKIAKAFAKVSFSSLIFSPKNSLTFATDFSIKI